MQGIYNTLKTCALISKTAGGIGLNVHKIRSKDSYISGTNGYSNGLVPMLRVFNNTARYVDQACGPSCLLCYGKACNSSPVLRRAATSGRERLRCT